MATAVTSRNRPQRKTWPHWGALRTPVARRTQGHREPCPELQISSLLGISIILLMMLSIVAVSAPSKAAPTPTAIALENQLPGDSDWLLHDPATGQEIQGYASATSVNRGESIAFYVDTVADRFDIEIFRLGFYRGAGARRLAFIPNLQGISQPKPCTRGDGVVDCDWRASFELLVPKSGRNSSEEWITGVYLARLTTRGSIKKDSYILFVVRDDERPPTYLVQLPVSTYQAYNSWGGQSLYVGCKGEGFSSCDPRKRSNRVSFNRPYGLSPNPKAAIGLGAGELITNLQESDEDYDISSAGYDINMIRWIERMGYDVGYITSVDLDQRPEILRRSKAFISIGHDEYYSYRMWKAVHDGIESGVNMAFFSANQFYWQLSPFANPA